MTKQFIQYVIYDRTTKQMHSWGSTDTRQVRDIFKRDQLKEEEHTFAEFREYFNNINPSNTGFKVR